MLYWQSHWFTFQSWKGDRNTITNYDRNRKSYTIFREENSFHPFAKHCECSVFIGMLFSTHLFFKDSRLKQMNYRSLWISATRGTKQTEWPLQLFSHIFPRIDLHINEDQRSFFEKFPFREEVTLFLLCLFFKYILVYINYDLAAVAT